MKKSTVALCVASTLATTGCMSLKGPQVLSCPAFQQFAIDIDTGPFIREIRCDGDRANCPEYESSDEKLNASLAAHTLSLATGTEAMPTPPTPADALDQALLDLFPNTRNKSVNAQGTRGILVLSGGGQWGAYGAGMFDQLWQQEAAMSGGLLTPAESHGDGDGQARPTPTGECANIAPGSDLSETCHLPKVGMITGVSTGALQTLLLTAALDSAIDERPGTLGLDPNPPTRASRKQWIEELTKQYTPKSESAVMNVGSFKSALINGSVAQTGPLRRLLVELLDRNNGELVEAIAKSRTRGYVGFVEARSGKMQFASLNQIAAHGDSREEQRDCLISAVMASASMPVFHQQLRVRQQVSGETESRTYYDGGVRRSVFLLDIVQRLDKLQPSTLSPSADLVPVYVVRNGPTIRPIETDPDEKSSMMTNGQRAYDLLVNESEIGSIARLRLARPKGRFFVTTADGYDGSLAGRPEKCTKESEDMFKPEFMKCLRKLGAYKASRSSAANPRKTLPGAWWAMSEVAGVPVSGSTTMADRADEGEATTTTGETK